MAAAERLYLAGLISCEQRRHHLIPLVGLTTPVRGLVSARSLTPKKTVRARLSFCLLPHPLPADPRTESTAYPASFDLRGAVAQQTVSELWGPYARELLGEGGGGGSSAGGSGAGGGASHERDSGGARAAIPHANRVVLTLPRPGLDAGDHPPVTPVAGCAGDGAVRALAGVGRDGCLVFGLICRHFLASVSPDAELETTEVSAFTTPRSPQQLAVLLSPQQRAASPSTSGAVSEAGSGAGSRSVGGPSSSKAAPGGSSVSRLGGQGGERGKGGKGCKGSQADAAATGTRGPRSPNARVSSRSNAGSGGGGGDDSGASGTADAATAAAAAAALEAALAVLRSEGEEFSLSSTSLVRPGYLRILRRDGSCDGPTPPPPFRAGDAFILEPGLPPVPLPAATRSLQPPAPRPGAPRAAAGVTAAGATAYAQLRRGTTTAPGHLAEWELLGER